MDTERKTSSPVEALKTVFAACVAVLAVAIGILVPALLALNTSAGHRWLAKTVSGIDGVSLERIEGSLLSDFTANGITLADPEGLWLRAQRVDVQWRPLTLFSRTADVSLVSIPHVEVVRAPAYQSEPSTEPFGISDLTDLPLSVQVGQVAVDRIIWQPGTAAEETVSVSGSAQIDRKTSLDATIALAPVGAEGSGDSIDANIFINTNAQTGDVTIDLRAGKDGLIASLAGLPDQTTAHIDGKGSVDNWAGTARATIGNVKVVQLDAGFQTPQGQLTGTLNPAPFVPAGTTDLLEAPLAVDIGVAEAGAGRVALDGTVSNEAMTLALSGAVVALNDIISADDLALAFNATGTAGPAALSGLDGTMTINGDSAAPDLALAMKAQSVTYNSISVVAPTLSGRTGLSDGVLEAKVSGSIDSVTGLEGLDPSVMQDITFDGTAAQTDTGLQARMQARNAVFEAELTDFEQRADESQRARIRVNVPNLSALPGSIPAGLKTQTLVTIAADGALAFNGGGSLDVSQAGTHWASRLASQTLAFDVDAAIKDDLTQLSLLEVRSDRVSLDAQAYLTNSRIDSTLIAQVEPSAFEDIAQAPVDGPATAKIAVNGPLATALPTGEIRIPALATAGLLLRDIAVSFIQRNSETGNAISISGLAQSDAGPLDITSVVKRPGDGLLLLEDLAAKLANIRVAGAAQVPIEADGAPTGSLKASLYTPAGSSDGLFGLSGRFDVAVDMPSETPGIVTVEGSGPVLRYKQNQNIVAAMSDITLSAEADLNAPDAAPSGQFAARAIEAAGIYLDALTAYVAVEEDGPAFSAKLTQISDHPTDLMLKGTAQTADDVTVIRTDVSGVFGGNTLASDTPITVTLAPVGLAVEPASLRLGEGTLTFNAAQTLDTLEASTTLADIEIAAVGHFLQRSSLSGTLSGKASVRSSPQAQSIDAAIDIENVTAQASETLPIDINAAVTSSTSQLMAEVEAGTPGKPGDASLTAAIPISWPAAPGLPTLQSKAPLTGHLTLDTALKQWWALADLADQTLEGRVKADIAVAGTLEKPALDGTVTLRDGRYEHLEFGTQLTALTGDIILAGDTLRVETLSAEDGRGGRLTAQGGVSLTTLAPSDTSVTLDDFQLIAKEGLEARASAALELKRVAERFELVGTVGIEEARYAIAASAAANVPTLPIEEINSDFLAQTADAAATTDPSAMKDTNKNDQAFPLWLDVSVNAPRRVFVTGMGLTSEWRTDLAITGPAATPDVKGQIQVVRGELEFAGKRFNLERGQIYLDGGTEIKPRLDILAQNTQGDFTARIGITGTPDNPTLTLSSNPALPDDEILSRILFGTSATDLSALEAVQLGSAVAALSGGGSGALDIAGKARSLTGLDRLTLGSADSSTAITGGKYLSEDLYLQFTTDPSSGQYLAAIEWYLTRSLSLLSQYGPQTGSNVAGRWSKTY
ncbi:MAG: translocation/assembly module TamB domain-containing protein [Pseudomonadota bacterium]